MPGPYSQKMLPVSNYEATLIEIVKYGSKIFTEPDLKKKGQSKVHPNIYLAALENIKGRHASTLKTILL